jgi:hypothetical protein
VFCHRMREVDAMVVVMVQAVPKEEDAQKILRM